MERVYDAVVVGSGVGGGITACRLAEQGRRVCVLECGRHFGPGDYRGRPTRAPRMFWHPHHNPGGMFDLGATSFFALDAIDSSIVPTAVEVNPSKTIAALAERDVEHLLAEAGR